MVAHSMQARLSEELRLKLVTRLAHTLNAELSPQDVLRRVLHAAAEALGTPHASLVALERHDIRAVYALGGGVTDPRPALERVLADGLAGFVAYNYRLVVVNDIAHNPLWLPLPDEPVSPQSGSALCVPLIHAGDMVGVLTLAHPATGYFSTDAVNLVHTIAEMGAAALAHALLLAENRLAQQRYRSLFNDALIPILVTDFEGNIRALNRRTCEFLGYAPEELLRRTIGVVHPRGMGVFTPENLQALRDGTEVRFRTVARTKTGEERPVQVFARRIHHHVDGDIIQWVERDLTPQVELEQLRRDLSAMVYHDMRGPLGNVHASIQALRALLADHPNESIQSLLAVASRSERQLQLMIDALLDVQRLEEGSRLLSRTSCDFQMVVDSALEQVRPLAEEKHIRLRRAIASDLPRLYIDANMIERVLVNLLDNAIKYSPEYSVVSLSTTSSGEEVYVRVKDTGPGIPPEAQAFIFNKYARIRQSSAARGVGLGLAFCKLAIEAHGGRIWVKSSDKHGSTFTFALPVDAPATHELPMLGMASS